MLRALRARALNVLYRPCKRFCYIRNFIYSHIMLYINVQIFKKIEKCMTCLKLQLPH
jgi:hypothetical protein